MFSYIAGKLCGQLDVGTACRHPPAGRYSTKGRSRTVRWNFTRAANNTVQQEHWHDWFRTFPCGIVGTGGQTSTCYCETKSSLARQ